MCFMEVLPEIEKIKIRGSSLTSKTALAMKEFIEEKYPRVKEIVICESLEEACAVHGVDCDQLVNRLNEHFGNQ